MPEEQAVVTRSEQHYIEDGNLFVRVQNTIYLIHRSTFTKRSPVFQDMFAFPQGDAVGVEGTVEENPLCLAGLDASDWDALLDFLYRPKPHWSLNELISLLKCGHRYQMQDVYDYARLGLTASGKSNLSPILKLYYGIICNNLEWISSSFRTVVGLPLNFISDNEAATIGLFLFRQVALARDEVMAFRSRLVTHTPAVIHHKRCKSRDVCDMSWRYIWHCGFLRIYHDLNEFMTSTKAEHELLGDTSCLHMYPSCAEATKKAVVDSGLFRNEDEIIQRYVSQWVRPQILAPNGAGQDESTQPYY
ncbi:hypothetical protein AURDEDRAFT_177655 [Auricularia subglabra TFB-10046 SS5]|uniref:BTB domain-containing protein n=1 Tax=Auricularia subglabra (strain TFB-10046 / SS5) TaxID=717982 RepID=J0LA43_AURST|nr:hypothetical protein AURDEDRAFT_177655 [Auricularia subglabra TFB-10046 SS5]